MNETHATGLIALAAAPTFAAMALATAAFDIAYPDMRCSAVMPAATPSGMVVMYLLMGAFHLGPWLRRIAAART